MSQYFFREPDGAWSGPVSAAALKAAAAAGRLDRKTAVRLGKDGPVKPAGYVEGVFPDEAAAEPAPSNASSAAAAGAAAGSGRLAGLGEWFGEPRERAPQGKDLIGVVAGVALLGVAGWWTYGLFFADSGPQPGRFRRASAPEPKPAAVAPAETPEDEPAAADAVAPAAVAAADPQTTSLEPAAPGPDDGEPEQAVAAADEPADAPTMASAEPGGVNVDEAESADAAAEPAPPADASDEDRRASLAEAAARPERFLLVRAAGGENTHRLVDAGTLTPVLDLWSPADDVRPVRGDGGLLYAPPAPVRGAAEDRPPTAVTEAPGVAWDPLAGRTAETRGADRPGGSSREEPRALFDPAAPRRAVVIAEGDLWRATVDWETGELTRGDRVTSLGLFDRLTPRLWVGDRLYFDNPLGVGPAGGSGGAAAGEGDGAVVVSLTDGSYETRPALLPDDRRRRAGEVGGRALSPDGRALVTAEPDVLRLTDLATGETRVAANLVRFEHPADPAADLRTPTPLIPALLLPPEAPAGRRPAERTAVWLDDRTLLAETAVGGLARVYVAAAAVRPADPPGAPRVGVWDVVAGRAERVDLLRAVGDRALTRRTAGGQEASRGPAGSSAEAEAALFDPNAGTTTAVPAPPDDARWVDDRRYVAVVPTGPLEEVGTWLHDVAGGSKRLLTRELAADGFTRVPDPERLLFRAGDAWFVAGLNGDAVRRLDGWEDVQAVGTFGPPVDLGLEDAPTCRAQSGSQRNTVGTVPPAAPSSERVAKSVTKCSA